MIQADRRFSGVARLFGADAAARFATTPIAVVGLGGVGSWAAEALVRTGCANLRLIDLDHVSESNTNRQLHAVEDSFGMSKVDAMALRLRTINPSLALRLIDDFVTPDNVDDCLAGTTLILECTDQVAAKVAMAAWAHTRAHTLVMSGAAGGKMDPTRLRSGDLARTTGDPLLAKVRHRLRKAHGFPSDKIRGQAGTFGVFAVWSDEPIRTPVGVVASSDAPQDASCVLDPSESASVGNASGPAGLSCAGYGSAVTVTASMGFAMAARALDSLV